MRNQIPSLLHEPDLVSYRDHDLGSYVSFNVQGVA